MARVTLMSRCFLTISPVLAGSELCAQGGGNSQTAPLLRGQWAGPYSMGISCNSGTPVDCDDQFGDANDEIGHASLIPVGPNRGHVLVWTKAQRMSLRGTNPYRSYFWDPDNPTGVAGHPPAMNDVAEAMTVLPEQDGPFCSGHLWVLDAEKNARLIAIGGNNFDGTGGAPASNQAYWFDPSGILDAGPPAITEPLWQDGPQEMPDSLWYGSLVRYMPTANSFGVMALGGSENTGAGCGVVGGNTYQFPRHWLLPNMATTTNWATQDDGHSWHQYPRAFMLYDGGQANVVAIGHTIICEYPRVLIGSTLVGDPNPNNLYGGNPCHKITNAGLTLEEIDSPNLGIGGPLPEVSLQTHTSADYPVGGWIYTSAALLHTLKPAYRTPQTSWPADATTRPANVWDLDRILVNGGGRENASGDEVTPVLTNPAVQSTWEWTPQGGWYEKASDPTPRAYGNLVLQPDGSLLAVGGQRDQTLEGESQETTAYRFGSYRFDPGEPGTSGEWTPMATRHPLGTSTDPFWLQAYGGSSYSMPRGYHSVALLLQDASVAIMGGNRTHAAAGSYAEFLDELMPDDSVEIFSPPFTFETGRPKIAVVPTADMYYGAVNEYCITVNDPTKVDYACLIGVGSVTHHFDYGQRYVELMIQRTGCGTGGNIKILPPTHAAMAPEGYYLLFVVQKRGQLRVPSVKGMFVKLRLP